MKTDLTNVSRRYPYASIGNLRLIFVSLAAIKVRFFYPLY